MEAAEVRGLLFFNTSALICLEVTGELAIERPKSARQWKVMRLMMARTFASAASISLLWVLEWHKVESSGRKVMPLIMEKDKKMYERRRKNIWWWFRVTLLVQWTGYCSLSSEMPCTNLQNNLSQRSNQQPPVMQTPWAMASVTPELQKRSNGKRKKIN